MVINIDRDIYISEGLSDKSEGNSDGPKNGGRKTTVTKKKKKKKKPRRKYSTTKYLFRFRKRSYRIWGSFYYLSLSCCAWSPCMCTCYGCPVPVYVLVDTYVLLVGSDAIPGCPPGKCAARPGSFC